MHAAEAQQHAASGAIGIASAGLYPNLTQCASWTSATSSAGALFGSGTNIWHSAAGLIVPIFDGHTLTAQRSAAINAYATQLDNYRQTVLQAFGQVADVLDSLLNDAALLDTQRKV